MLEILYLEAIKIINTGMCLLIFSRRKWLSRDVFCLTGSLGQWATIRGPTIDIVVFFKLFIKLSKEERLELITSSEIQR